MLRTLCVALAMVILSGITAAHAQTERASASISDVSLGGGVFAYTISLTDTSAVNIETFWNAWVPGKDFMAVSPTSIVSPTGWTSAITGGGGTDGFAIMWTTSTTPLTPNQTFNFSFDSTVAPAAMNGNSVFYPTTPVETSFIYQGAAFGDAGNQFIVQPVAAVPEPSAGMLASLGGLGLVAMGAARKRCPAQAIARH
jgi:hypothetical protein